MIYPTVEDLKSKDLSTALGLLYDTLEALLWAEHGQKSRPDLERYLTSLPPEEVSTEVILSVLIGTAAIASYPARNAWAEKAAVVVRERHPDEAEAILHGLYAPKETA